MNPQSILLNFFPSVYSLQNKQYEDRTWEISELNFDEI